MKNILYRIREPVIGVVFFIIVNTVQYIYTGHNSVYQILGAFSIIIIGYYGLWSSYTHRKATTITRKVIAFGLGVGLIAIATLIYSGIEHQALFIHAYKQMPLLALYSVLLAPVGEEIVYRQILYRNCFSHHRMAGRIIIGLLFVLSHGPTTLTSFSFYVAATVGLFIAYEMSGDDVRVSIGVHMLNNLLVLL